MDGEHVIAGLAAALRAGALTADAVALESRLDQGDGNLRQFWSEPGYAQVVLFSGGVAEVQDRVIEAGGSAWCGEIGQDLIELLLVDLHGGSRLSESAPASTALTTV
ncbi:hypothetical protein ABZ260_12115 [Streptosporangium sp. NPDC006013]|uniref:hypothetical protein n=1 Tax=Streptosporangium sp. NPDC006013 TaxID=3155596 RepID=UPI00339F4B1E